MDWIEEFLSVTEYVRSPYSFRLWTAIAVISSVLERRVWTHTDIAPLYPNLYTVLAGSPASGKTVMVTTAREAISPLIKPDGITIGPDNPSPASFMDRLHASMKISINGMGVPLYSAMTVLCSEFGDLISKYDKDFAAKLSSLYDNPANYDMPRRTTKSINIEAPCVNLLAGATPAALGDIIPESAWGQGLTSRIIFIYGVAPTFRRHIFRRPKVVEFEKLQKELKVFFEELHGEFIWEEPAQVEMESWFNDKKMAPVPDYERLVYYAGRRDIHVLKLAMVSAVSAGHGLTVTKSDFDRALSWLLEAEQTMPDVFRAMAQKSDFQLLQDAHRWMIVKYGATARSKRVPINEREVWKFFEDKTTHDKIAGLMLAMEKSGRMKKGLMPGDWIPAPADPDPGAVNAHIQVQPETQPEENSNANVNASSGS